MCDTAKTCLKQKGKDNNKNTRRRVFIVPKNHRIDRWLFDCYHSLAYRFNPTDCFERSEYDFERQSKSKSLMQPQYTCR